MRLIILRCGRVTRVDDADFEKVRHLKWWHTRLSSPKSLTRYVYAFDGDRQVLLHRVIFDAPAGSEVDHKNRDGLDNRRANLRLATRAENASNCIRKNRTGFRGVTYIRKRFRASISRYPVRFIGTFDTPEEAARAYDQEALRRFGEFAQLNFPETAAADG